MFLKTNYRHQHYVNMLKYIHLFLIFEVVCGMLCVLCCSPSSCVADGVRRDQEGDEGGVQDICLTTTKTENLKLFMFGKKRTRTYTRVPHGSITFSTLSSCLTNDLHVSVATSFHHGFPRCCPYEALVTIFRVPTFMLFSKPL